MKWLLVLLIVLGGIWWLRQVGRGRSRDPSSSAPSSSQPSSAAPADTPPQVMTRCLHCGLHLPVQDAVSGKLGDYCSPAHRQQREA